MPKIKQIFAANQRLDLKEKDKIIYNAQNASDINNFRDILNPASANSLRVLKSYVDSAIIPEEALTFDDTPAIGSNNPVTSDGIYRFVLKALEDYFNYKIVVLTQAEYDEIEEPDPNKFYFIQDEEEIEPED